MSTVINDGFSFVGSSDYFIINVEEDNGYKMWQGLVGPYFTPSVDVSGNLSWTNNGGLANPTTVNIQGPAGESFSIAGIVATTGDLPSGGESGVWLVGDDAPYDAYSYISGAWTFIGQLAIGPEGPSGAAAGFGTPTATVDALTGTPSVTVTASGPDTAKVFAFAFHNLKGATGSTGQTGPQGVSIVSTSKASGTGAPGTTDTYNVNLSNSTVAGQFTVYNGSDGGSPGTQDPLMDGTATPGTATALSREDHVHPSDTSKVDRVVVLADNTDLNTVLTSGFYRTGSGGSNLPTGADGYSQLIVSRGQDTIAQVYINYSNAKTFVRSANNINTTPNWQAWKQIAFNDGSNISSASDWKSALGISNKVLYLTSVACSATTGDFVSVSNASITADHVLADVVFANPSYITSDVTWTSGSGTFTLNGTCSTATTCTLVLIQKDN